MRGVTELCFWKKTYGNTISSFCRLSSNGGSYYKPSNAALHTEVVYKPLPCLTGPDSLVVIWIYLLWFHLYETQNQEQLICGDKDQNSDPISSRRSGDRVGIGLKVLRYKKYSTWAMSNMVATSLMKYDLNVVLSQASRISSAQWPCMVCGCQSGQCRQTLPILTPSSPGQWFSISWPGCCLRGAHT